MRTHHGMLQRIAQLGLILMMGASMNTNAGWFGFGGDSWKEEVLLHDGQRIIVKRSVERGGRHEIGQQPPYKEQSLAFTFPTTNESVTWKTEFSEDVGLADFKPILLDIIQGKAYIVTTPMGCLSYNKWGRPNPPYVVFRYEGKGWKRITLQELPAPLKTPNLIISSPDNEVKRIGKSLIAADEIKRLNGELTQSEYKTILRDPYPGAGGCPEMVYDGHGGWLSISTFKRYPSLDECLRFCEREDLTAEHCLCNKFYKGK